MGCPRPIPGQEVLMSRVVEWREVYQQRRIAEALEKMLDRERGWEVRVRGFSEFLNERKV